MNRTTNTLAATTIAVVLATSAYADSRIHRFCGPDHVNEMTSAEDVRSNPDGYYVGSLAEQLSTGDPRIILTNNSDFHLCTRPHVTPASSANAVYRGDGGRVVKYLFVPIIEWREGPAS